MQQIRNILRVLVFAACGGALMPAPPARATLALTTAGIADGFSLSTFVTMAPGNTGCCNGPFGIAVSGSGASAHVLVGLGSNGTNYAFTDLDNQTIGDALTSSADLHSGSYTPASATVGGVAYGSNASYQFVQFNSDGSINHVLTGVSYSALLGMWGTPDGHIIASTNSGIIDINPTANGGLGSARLINTVVPDGVTISPDGTTIYAEVSGQLFAYDRTTGAQIGTALNNSGAPDGTGVINGGAYNGDLIANTNFGNIDLIDVLNNTFTTIATGGTRGDYVSPDPTNGTLFLTYSDIVARLSCGSGCSIGSAVPEPMSLSLLAAGVMGLGLVRRRRAR